MNKEIEDALKLFAMNDRAERILCAMIAAGKSPVNIVDAQALANCAVEMAEVAIARQRAGVESPRAC